MLKEKIKTGVSNRMVVLAVDQHIHWFSRNGTYYVHPDRVEDFRREVAPLL